MASSKLNKNSFYGGSCIILTTKHAKSIAIAPPFSEILGASILEYVIDTDKFGTFSGEIERQGTALECVRRKCELPFNKLGPKVLFSIASEGSFSPHPFSPFLPCDHEILYFIDRKIDFHLYLSTLSIKTNYRMQLISSIDELEKFAQVALFPSHALILRPTRNDIGYIFKGIQSFSDLQEAFKNCQKYSLDGRVSIETDMRAQFNPSRMLVIKELAIRLALQLNTNCYKCNTPGWGKVSEEIGLKCSECGLPIELVKSEIFGCLKCHYKEKRNRADGIKQADPGNCGYCNP